MWTMPRSTLQVVAAFIALVAVSGLALGFVSAPQRARLPGESVGGPSSAPIVAPDAMPIVDAPPPPPPEKTEAEKLAELEKEKAEAEKEQAKLVEKAPPPIRMPAPPPELTVPVAPPVEPPPAPEPPAEIPPF